MIALVEDEHLSLVGEPAKRRRVDDPVAVAAEIAAGEARGLHEAAAAALPRIGRKGRAGERWGRHEFNSLGAESALY